MADIRSRACALITAVILCVLSSGAAWAQTAMPPGLGGGQAASGMPDARMMSGIPMPVADLPDGTVAVRVVRGEIANLIKRQAVELSVDGKSQTATTDEAGRAQFSPVPAGAKVRATATVGGEKLESQEFQMPAKGGIRLLLVALGGISAAPAPDAKPVAGTVTLGGETRIIVELDDDTLTVFYVLDVVNGGAAPVNPATPVVFDLPRGAMSPGLMEGSSPQAEVKGGRVTFSGPFKPGRTSAQFAFGLPPAGETRTIEQAFPVAIDTLSVEVQKVGALQVRSAQLTSQRDVTTEGKLYVMAAGPTLPAGRTLSIELSGLPHRETWPRTVAYALALAILGIGAWVVMGTTGSGGVPAQARRRELEGTRERLYAELVRLEEASRGGRVEAGACANRRAVLVADLERIYAELDTLAHAGGDRGIAA
jgi:hypothetical protein